MYECNDKKIFLNILKPYCKNQNIFDFLYDYIYNISDITQTRKLKYNMIKKCKFNVFSGNIREIVYKGSDENIEIKENYVLFSNSLISIKYIGGIK